MIESLMVFALGALVAGLLALLVVPAINARAERLARRRVEALFPMSIDELTAEKDHLRAEFAVMQRRLERRAEEAKAGKAAEMEELGRRAVRIEALSVDLAARDRTIATVEGERDAALAKLAVTEADLAATKARLDTADARIGELEPLHARTVEELEAARAELASLAQRLGATEAEREAARADSAARAAAHAELSQRQERTLQDLDARRIAISDLETRLATERGRVEEAERRLAAGGAGGEAALIADNEDLRRRIAGLADQILASAPQARESA